MSEQTPEPTNASDLEFGGDKPGTDYGSTTGIGGAGDEGSGGEPPADEAGNGAAVPDDPSAEAAQDGVQEAFGVAPQLD